MKQIEGFCDSFVPILRYLMIAAS